MLLNTVAFAVSELCSSVTLCILLTLLCIYWWRRPHPRFPPGPRGLPLLGNALFMGRVPSRTMKKWSVEKYGPVMSVKMGFEDVVVLNTFEAVNLALVKQSTRFSSRPPSQLMSATDGLGIIGKTNDESFKVQKHFGLKFLREKGLAKSHMEQRVNEEGDQFVKFLRKIEAKSVDIKKYFYWLTVNVISNVALGKRFEYGDPEFLEIFEIISSLLDPKDAKKLAMITLFRFLWKVPVFSWASDRLDQRLSKILDTMQQYIDEHRKTFDPDNLNDFIDAFLYEQKFRQYKNESFTDEQLRIYCQNWFIAGSETTSTTLTWCFVFLLNHPEYQKHIDDEIDNCIGRAGVPSMSHREQMPVTCAFIQEVMRMKTILPLAAPHKTSETTELMGFVIPKGTRVIVNLDGVHMDPNEWPDPEAFNPRRHIDENGRFVPSKKIIPFSVGSRFCLGESLAKVEIFVFFVKMIQNFHVRSGKSGPPPMDEDVLSFVMAPKECVVTLHAKQ